jgi:hypothetical protein
MGTGINEGQIMSGSAATTVYANILQITSDTAAVTGTNSIQTLNVTDAFGGSTVQGGRHALVGGALMTAPTSASNTFDDFVGVVGFAQANTGDAGTNLTTSPKGNFFGGSFYYNLLNGATNLGVASALELNSFAQTGSSLVNKDLIALVGGGTLDQVAGSKWDAMLQLSRQSGGIGFQAGILFTDAYGVFPVPATGTLIEAFAGPTGAPTGATVANGIDFSKMTFTGCSALLGTNGPNFCGNGATFGGAPVSQAPFLTMLSNVGGASPAAASTTFSLSNNFSNASREVDIWNDDTAATLTLDIRQLTGGGSVSVGSFNLNRFAAPVGVQVPQVAVSALPTCSAGSRALLYEVVDATTATWRSIPAGGGANNLLVMCDGANWVEM